MKNLNLEEIKLRNKEFNEKNGYKCDKEPIIIKTEDGEIIYTVDPDIEEMMLKIKKTG